MKGHISDKKNIKIELKNMRKGKKKYFGYMRKLKQENEMKKNQIGKLKTKTDHLVRDKMNNLIITINKDNEINMKIDDEFLKQEIQVETKIKTIKTMENRKLSVEMKTLKDKIQVVKTEKKLRQINNKIIYINGDLIKEEK